MTADQTPTPSGDQSSPVSSLIGKRIAVLDKGWIELQALMGDDLAIVNAARVSFLGESKGAEQDKKLLFYLMRHRHTSPFEQVEFKFRVRAPVMTWWQWVRHRTWSFNAQCLAGDTLIIFDKPETREKDGFCVGSKLQIGEIYRRWQTWERDRLRKMRLRTVDEDTMFLSTAHIGDVVYAGKKPGYKVTTRDGHQIICSSDHQFLFEDGWKTLSEGTGLKLVGRHATWDQLPRIYLNGRQLETAHLYTDKEWLNYQYHTRHLSIAEIASLAGCTTHTIRKYLGRFGLTSEERRKQSQFQAGQTAWNTKRSYSLGETPQQKLERSERARLSVPRGADCHFWKGGTSSARANIGRWTTDIASYVFARDRYQCRLCGKGPAANDPFHAHHVVPIWADISLAYSLDNLVTLHQSCHQHIHHSNHELEFAQSLQHDISFDVSLKESAHESSLLPHGHATPRLVEVASIEYVGETDMYDLVVDGPYPNFVANWFIVHNSGRYVAFEEDDFYMPSAWRKQSPSNKQASLGELSLEEGESLSDALAEHYARGYQLYRQAIEAGVARELARVFLPGFAVYYTWVAKVDAHNLMHFLRLRMADEAQYEIRAYAKAIYEHFFKPALPWTAEAFEQLVLNAPSP